MSQNKKEPPITLQDVTNWTLGNADERVKRRIEDDLKRPDSEVREYIDWAGGDPAKQSTPRLAQRDLEGVVKAAGGWRALAERLKAMEGRDETPRDRRR
jgi:hypothetical protein